MSAKGAPPVTLSTRIFRAFFLTISVFGVFSFLSYNLERHLMLRSSQMLQSSMSWAQLAEDTERLEAALAKFLVTGDREARLTYERLALSFRRRASALRGATAQSADALAVEDLLGMTATLLEEATTAMAARQRRDFDEGNEAFRAFALTGEALRNRIYQAVVDRLRRESASYQKISRRLVFVGRASFVLVMGGLGLALL
ncbi:MAG: hypothetical protein GX493_12085 [Firmicutes bacterium]|nr:hypothetical protein [Bacillota bacterium]